MEIIVSNRGRGPEAFLKVTARGYLVAYCRSPAELARFVALSDLIEVKSE